MRIVAGRVLGSGEEAGVAEGVPGHGGAFAGVAHGGADIFADHVGLQIDEGAGGQGGKCGFAPGVGNEVHGEGGIGGRHLHDGEADPVQSDGALGNDFGDQGVGGDR